MDSLTQIVLGAAVGEATLGKKVGNRAPLWGAIGGTIPDLDVITSFFQGEFEYFISHRGFTHSITFCVLMAPLLGILIHRVYKGQWGSVRDWTRLSFWAFLTHTLLDCCTSWGTQLFYPFSDYRVAWNNIFVADPLYTLPFLACVIVVLFLHRENKWRRRWNNIGLVISSFYLLLTFLNKGTINAHFVNAFHAQGKSVQRYSTYPTPFNNLLWYTVGESPSAYYLGLHSLLGDPRNIQFTEIPKNHQLIEGYEDQRVIERLIWMSKGYYSLSREAGELYWHDLRFGIINQLTDESPEEPIFVFTFRLLTEDGTFYGIESDGPPGPERLDAESLAVFWEKIMGR